MNFSVPSNEGHCVNANEYRHDFIELDRTFHELSRSAGGSDDVDLHSVFYTGSGITWDTLLTEYRVVLLSEAGSGKTAEIRHAAHKLRGVLVAIRISHSCYSRNLRRTMHQPGSIRQVVRGPRSYYAASAASFSVEGLQPIG